MLNTLIRVIEVSLGCSIAMILLMVLTKLLSKQFSPLWRRWAWFLLILQMCFVFPLEVMSPPVTIHVPAILSETVFRGYEGFQRDAAMSRYSGVTSGGTSVSKVIAGEDPFVGSYTVGINLPEGRKEIDENHIFRTVTEADGTVTKTAHIASFLYVGWLSVAVGSFLLVQIRYRRFRENALEHSVPASEEDLAELERQKLRRSKLRHKVELRRCSEVRSPVLMGIFAPVILLPEELPQEAMGAALAHELTHLYRADTFLLQLCALARSVHWFNPLAWLMMGQVRQTIEECCDYELLSGCDLNERRDYGRAILDQMTAQRGISGLTTGFSGDKRSLVVRFRAIMDTAPKKLGGELILVAAILVVLSGNVIAFRESIPVSDYAGYTGEVQVMLYDPVAEEDITLTFDPYEDQDGLRNTDTTVQILPLSPELKMEDTDYYRIAHRFEGVRLGTQVPIWYTLYLKDGMITDMRPGDWFALSDSDIPMPYYVPLDWTQDFFRAFSDGDYEMMRSFCTPECADSSLFFGENSAFWFVQSRVLSAEVLAPQSGGDVKIMECLVEGTPVQDSALYGVEGPYVLWLTCRRTAEDEWKIDDVSTGSMLKGR